MSNSIPQPQDGLTTDKNVVRELYTQLLAGWNSRNAHALAEPFAEDGEIIGFDGSQLGGKAEIISELGQIFADHPTPPYFSKVKSVRLLSPNVAVLRAIVGMVLPGQASIESSLNAHQTLVAYKREGGWRIALFQTTPAQFHGRPDLVQQMTEELQQLLPV